MWLMSYTPEEGGNSECSQYLGNGNVLYVSDTSCEVEDARALADRKLTEVPIVVFDTETTGLHPEGGDKIIEIALHRIEPDGTIVQYSQLLDPQRTIEDKVTQITGISADDLIGAPTFGDIRHHVSHLLTGAVVVAHNATFDTRFLEAEYKLHGELPPIQPVIDTLGLAKDNFTFPNNKLTTIAEALQLNVRSDAHRAFADVEMTVAALREMMRRMQEQDPSIQTARDFMNRTKAGELLTVPVVSENLVQAIGEALTSGDLFTFLYKKPRERTGKPRRLQVTGFDGAYVVGMDADREAERNFRVDRMQL